MTLSNSRFPRSLLATTTAFSGLMCSFILSAASCSGRETEHGAAAGDSISSSVAKAVDQASSYSRGAIRARAQALRQNVALELLLDTLPTLQGAFPSEDLLEFSGDATVLVAIALYGEDAVASLLNCMGAETPTAATFAGKQLLLGHLCKAVLDLAVYHEATDQRGDIAGNWPGYTTFEASHAELLGAQKAWRTVVARRQYLLRDI
jgi:hypothetical protein